MMSETTYVRAATALRDCNVESVTTAQIRAALDVLASTLAIDEPALLGDHVRWAGAMSIARGDPENDAKAVFSRLRTRAERVTDSTARELVLRFLAEAQTPTKHAAGKHRDESHADPDAQRYLEMLIAHQAHDSRFLADQAAAFGDLQSIYFELLEPALLEAGERWERAEISVSRVHHVTDMTLRIMNDLLNRQLQRARDERTLLALCVEKEQHDVGLRMIADQLQVKGWKIVFFGADVPFDECPAAVRENAPTVVGLSVTMAAHLDRARHTIAAIREVDAKVPIVIGGLPFRAGGDLWKKIGATAGATSGAAAVAAVERLGNKRRKAHS